MMKVLVVVDMQKDFVDGALANEMAVRIVPLVREKILAAKRAGVVEIVISEDNRKDIEDIKPVYIEGLSFHYVRTIDEVISHIFV